MINKPQPNKEIIWHFTCSECNGFWSIAVMDAWKPYKLYCPHCGNREDHSSQWGKLRGSEWV